MRPSRRSWFLIGFSQCALCLQNREKQPAAEDDVNERIYNPADVTSAARPLHLVKPSYTDRARRNAVQGTVILQFVINSEGIPKQIRISKSLDVELDQASVDALKMWRFSPATKDNKPVAVRASLEFTFGVV